MIPSQSSKIHVLQDDSGYYVTWEDTSSQNLFIWKYLFADTLATWYQVLTILYNPFAQLMINDNEFYFTGIGISNNMYFLKFAYGDITVKWANYIACTYGAWSTANSEFLIDKKGTKLYSIFIYKNNYEHAYFATFDPNSGSVLDIRYKSNILWTYWASLVQNGDYLATIVEWTNFYLIMLNTVTKSFTISQFSSSICGGGCNDPTTGR